MLTVMSDVKRVLEASAGVLETLKTVVIAVVILLIVAVFVLSVIMGFVWQHSLILLMGLIVGILSWRIIGLSLAIMQPLFLIVHFLKTFLSAV
jgi:hypothetical protein